MNINALFLILFANLHQQRGPSCARHHLTILRKLRNPSRGLNIVEVIIRGESCLEEGGPEKTLDSSSMSRCHSRQKFGKHQTIKNMNAAVMENVQSFTVNIH